MGIWLGPTVQDGADEAGIAGASDDRRADRRPDQHRERRI